MRWLLCALLHLAVLRVDASKGHSLTKAQWRSGSLEGLRDLSAHDLLAEDEEDDKEQDWGQIAIGLPQRCGVSQDENTEQAGPSLLAKEATKVGWRERDQT
eukprot:Skav221842  [mRNA]  locus=scaffold126:100488:103860:+ [translate_table: standard]